MQPDRIRLSVSTPSTHELDELETRVQRAFDGSNDLEVLGYGEVSSVVGLDSESGRYAAKRLPPFPDSASRERYQKCFQGYLEKLRSCGVEAIESVLVPTGDPLVLYCMQPRLDPSALAVNALVALSVADGVAVLTRIVDLVQATVAPRLGLDAQLSNWVVDGDALRYLDVTTPLLRGEDGKEELDIELFVASLPWIIRGAVRRFMLRDILATYYDPRRTVVDLLANLLKERLDEVFAAAIEEFGSRFDPAITAAEARRYYKSDARTWALLQRLRRIDRAWQRSVRRRTYPFLLPGKIAR